MTVRAPNRRLRPQKLAPSSRLQSATQLDAARAQAGLFRTSSRFSRTREGLAFSPLVLPGRPGALAVLTKIDSEGVEDFRRVLAAKTPGALSRSSASRSLVTRPTSRSSWPGRTPGRFDVQMSIQASSLGQCSSRPIRSTRSPKFPGTCRLADEYARILREREGVDPNNASMFKAKTASYAERLGPMNRQRLFPGFPDWPCLCFYPMSKDADG